MVAGERVTALVGVGGLLNCRGERNMKDNRRAYLWFVGIVIVVIGLFQIFKSVLSTDANSDRPKEGSGYSTY